MIPGHFFIKPIPVVRRILVNMAENVKFIFKTLIKVPIIIFVTYFIVNLFAFTVSYFRLLGVSYVVLQTAIENN